MSRETRITLRLPQGLAEKVASQANANNRSMNSEIIACLAGSESNSLSLRDWIAGQALAGMLAHGTRYRPWPDAPSNWHAEIAEESYEIADAMLAARERQP